MLIQKIRDAFSLVMALAILGVMVWFSFWLALGLIAVFAIGYVLKIIADIRPIKTDPI